MQVEKPNLIIYGRVIALSQVEEIPSKEQGKPSMKKQKLYMDCTRYDSITGLRDERENKPLLEFGGDKLIEKVAALDLKKGDVVGVRFAIQGTPYKDEKTGKNNVFTGIRCYDIEIIRKADGTVAAPAPQPANNPSPAPEQMATSKDGTDGLPF